MTKNDYLEDELLILRDGGEIPEVALHGSLHYLTRDPDGPGLELDAEDLALLHRAVYDRYLWIILRDCDPRLRDKPIYRGLARCVANWRRFVSFCRRVGLDPEPARCETARALVAFLANEVEEVSAGRRASSVNCTAADLAMLLAELAIDPAELPEGWETLCCGAT